MWIIGSMCECITVHLYTRLRQQTDLHYGSSGALRLKNECKQKILVVLGHVFTSVLFWEFV